MGVRFSLSRCSRVMDAMSSGSLPVAARPPSAGAADRRQAARSRSRPGSPDRRSDLSGRGARRLERPAKLSSSASRVWVPHPAPPSRGYGCPAALLDGYGARALIGACLGKSLYATNTWTRTARLIAEHGALAEAIGCSPSEWACYRFAVKLRAHSPLVEATLGAIVSALRAELPEYAKDIAIDASDLPAYANGQRFVSKGGRERERFSAPMHFCRVFGGISVWASWRGAYRRDRLLRLSG
jgi:hypothetical protein